MRDQRTPAHRRTGLTAIELVAILAAVILLLALTLPGIAGARGSSGLQFSLNNLATIGAAHVVYAADWNDRQYTNIDDDMSTYGDDPGQAVAEWSRRHGPCSSSFENRPNCPPSVILGLGCSSRTGVWGYWTWGGIANFQLSMPASFDLMVSEEWDIGVYRIPNAKPFHDYLNGRFYDPVLYAPNDHVPYARAAPAFGASCEFFPDLPEVTFSSYCFSPAAMFHPDVLRAQVDGGFQDPWLIDHGFRSPAFSAAAYPDLKTHVIEHHWVQNAPADRCNPDMDSEWYPCAPYFFNHALDSEPAALFYDLHAQVLPNRKVQADDQRVLKQTGGVDGLWSRDTTLGADGYFLQYAADPDVDVSHHVLTTDGILGRDILAP